MHKSPMFLLVAVFLSLLLASLCLTAWTQSIRAANTYSAAIWAWDSVYGWVSEPISMDHVSTGFTTPHNFTGLSGYHSFLVPNTDVNDNRFYNWTATQSNATIFGNTITVFEGGVCTAEYYPPYNATIQAWDSVHGWLSEPITWDGIDSGFMTPKNLTLWGTDYFSLPAIDTYGDPFYNWTTGTTTLTLAISSGGTYTAQYYPPYNATIWAWDSASAWLNEPITMDGVSTGFNTPHNFTGLIGTHNFTVPSTDVSGNPFVNWTTGETSTNITVSSGGTYTAQYYYGTIPEFDSAIFLAVIFMVASALTLVLRRQQTSARSALLARARGF